MTSPKKATFFGPMSFCQKTFNQLTFSLRDNQYIETFLQINCCPNEKVIVVSTRCLWCNVFCMLVCFLVVKKIWPTGICKIFVRNLYKKMVKSFKEIW
jgi:hypothetical protein